MYDIIITDKILQKIANWHTIIIVKIRKWQNRKIKPSQDAIDIANQWGGIIEINKIPILSDRYLMWDTGCHALAQYIGKKTISSDLPHDTRLSSVPFYSNKKIELVLINNAKVNGIAQKKIILMLLVCL